MQVAISTLALLASSLLVSPAFCQTKPRDQLLDLVPERMSFCMLLQDVRGQLGPAGKDLFLGQIAQSPFVQQAVHAPELKKLLEIQDFFCRQLDITPNQLRDDIFGDAVVLAFRHASAQAKGETDVGMVLLSARDGKLLGDIIQKLNTLQVKAGEVASVQERKHAEQTYYARIKAKGKGDDEFYFTDGSLLIFSSEEALLQTALQTRSQLKNHPNGSGKWRTLFEKSGLDQAMFSLLIQPRAFDPELHQSLTSSRGAEHAFLLQFSKHWKAIETLGIAVENKKELELRFAMVAAPANLPPETRRFLNVFQRPSTLGSVIPTDALLGIMVRCDMEAFGEMFNSFLDKSSQQQVHGALQDLSQRVLGKGNRESLLKGLDADWGFWMMAPPTSSKSWMPRVAIAVKLQSGLDGQKAAEIALQAIDKLISFAELSVAGLSGQKLSKDGIEQRTIHAEKVFPEGLIPSFAVKGGYLLLTTHPELVRSFTPGTTPSQVAEETVLLRTSAIGWQNYFKSKRKELALLFKNVGWSSETQTLELLDRWNQLFQLVDRAELSIQTRPNRVTLSLKFSLRSANPNP